MSTSANDERGRSTRDRAGLVMFEDRPREAAELCGKHGSFFRLDPSGCGESCRNFDPFWEALLSGVSFSAVSASGRETQSR